MSRSKTILILGASGFVGRHVAENLALSGYDVRATSRSDGVDLREPEELRRVLVAHGEVNIVVNCAARVGSLVYVTEQAADVVDDNMRLLLNLYKIIAESSRSTVILNPVANCAFPSNFERFREGDLWSGPLHPSVMSYGSTRRMMTVLAECYRQQYGIRTISLFVPNMYGPFESTDPTKAHALSALVSKVVKAKRERRAEVEVWGSGIAVREWLYAPDFARCVVKLLEDSNLDKWSTPVNIAQNSGLSVRELIAIIVEAVQYTGKIVWDASKPDGAAVKIMDDELFRTRFPDFTFTHLTEGIAKTAAYYDSVYPY